MQNENILASLDIGSNSVILLVTKVLINGKIEVVDEFIATTKLGENLSVNNNLTQEAMDRTLRGINELIGISEKYKITKLIVSATSAVREANNKSSFLLQCKRQFDFFPQVLSGKEEARLAFNGAIYDFKSNSTPIIFFDVGGGSTEIVYGFKDDIVDSKSILVGAVNIAEAYSLQKPFVYHLKQYQINKKIKDDLGSFKDEIFEWLKGQTPQIFICGGTATSLVAMIQKSVVYDRQSIHGTVVSNEVSLEYLKKLANLNIKDRIQKLKIDPQRAGVMPAGLFIINSLLKQLKLNEFEVSCCGLRSGIISQYIEKSI